MRLKLFLVCALACGFMAYVLANENISTEEFEDQIINAVPEPVKADKPKNQAEFVEVPKATPVVKKVEEEEKPKTKPLALQKPTLIPVVHVTSRGTDDVLTVAGLKPQKMFGALVMPNDYLGELYDVDNSGYNWGESISLSLGADSVPPHYSYAALTILSEQLSGFQFGLVTNICSITCSFVQVL